MKKICMTICGIVGVLACGTIVQGRTTETQNVNIVSSANVKVGDYICVKQNSGVPGSSGYTMKVSIYETSNMCGNYYALINGESYKVQIGSWRRFTGPISPNQTNETYSYSFVYDGDRYLFNM